MKKDKAYFEQFSTAQLETLLQEMLSRPGHDEDEDILTILEVMSARDSLHAETDEAFIDASWEEFKTHYMNGPDLYPCEEDDDGVTPPVREKEVEEENVVPIRPARKIHRPLRVAMVAALTICLMFAFTIGAQASGYDVFGLLGRWTDDIFQFQVSRHTPTPEQEEVSREFQAAIDSIGIQQNLAPTWWPEEFKLYDSTVERYETFSQVTLDLWNEEENTSLCISVADIFDESLIENSRYQKDDRAVEYYESNGRAFYIMSNIDTMIATWSNGGLNVEISGQISKEEIKGIIDSIGG